MTFLANHDDSRALYAIPGEELASKWYLRSRGLVSEGEASDVLSFAGRDHGTENCAARVAYLGQGQKVFLSVLFLYSVSLTSSASLCQAWTMSAMKTSSPTPPRIRFPSNMSSLKDFFSMTRQKVVSQERGRAFL